MIVELEIELDDAVDLPDALVIVYRTRRGLEASFRRTPESPVPPRDCALVAMSAIQAFEATKEPS